MNVFTLMSCYWNLLTIKCFVFRINLIGIGTHICDLDYVLALNSTALISLHKRMFILVSISSYIYDYCNFM